MQNSSQHFRDDTRHEVTVAGDEGSRRLDRVLAVRSPDLSRSRLKALILAGQVHVGGSPVRDPAYHVNAGIRSQSTFRPRRPPSPKARIFR
jgi:23S rRNA pseudouridine1911/1915/1917 synthase